MKPKYILHHDDPPCNARLTPRGDCKECGLHPDMQSTSLWPYCPNCDTPLKNMTCPRCNRTYKGDKE
jgi:hypothetical protein